MLSFWTKSNPEDVWDLHSTDLLFFPLHVVAHYSITCWWRLVFSTAIWNGRTSGKWGSSLHLYICAYVPSVRGMPKDMGNECCIRTDWKCRTNPSSAQTGNRQLTVLQVQPSRHHSFIGRELLEGGSMPWHLRYPQGLCTWLIFTLYLARTAPVLQQHSWEIPMHFILAAETQ